MSLFEVHAFEEGCHYSTKVMDLFHKAMIHPYDLITYERFSQIPKNHMLPTMPRVFFKGRLVGGCTNVFDATHFIRNKLQAGKGWSKEDTNTLRNTLIDASSFDEKHMYHLIEALLPLARNGV